MAVIKEFRYKRPTKMIKKAIGGMINNEIYVHIGKSYDFIEAHCTSIAHPDYKYKRFPCTLEGYVSAYDWVLNTGWAMWYKRIDVAAGYPRCYDWTAESVKLNHYNFQ